MLLVQAQRQIISDYTSEDATDYEKTLSIILAIISVVTVLPFAFAAEKETVILYTNDVRCAIDDYPVLAAYKAELIAQGKNVVTVETQGNPNLICSFYS